MLLDTTVLIADPEWRGYKIQVIGINTEAECFQVLNAQDKQVRGTWCTVEGATACAELLAEGYWKE